MSFNRRSFLRRISAAVLGTVAAIYAPSCVRARALESPPPGIEGMWLMISPLRADHIGLYDIVLAVPPAEWISYDDPRMPALLKPVPHPTTQRDRHVGTAMSRRDRK